MALNSSAYQEKDFGPSQLNQLFDEYISVKIAEKAPPDSDSPLCVNCHYESAYEAIGALIATRLIVHERDNLSLEPFLRRVANDCYHHNYQGNWEVVQDILSTKPFNLVFMLKTIYNNFTEEEFWGNIVKFIRNAFRGIKWYPMYSYKKRRVRRPKRKRGYDDKGFLRPKHKMHYPKELGELIRSEETLIDRREEIMTLKRHSLYNSRQAQRVGLNNTQLSKFNQKGELYEQE